MQTLFYRLIFLVIIGLIPTSAQPHIKFTAGWDPVVQTAKDIEEQGLLDHYILYLCDQPIPNNPGKAVGEETVTPVTCPGTLVAFPTGPVRTDKSGYLQGQDDVPGEACTESTTIRVQAEMFDEGANGDTYFDDSAGNSGNANPRSFENDVDMRHIPADMGGGITIGWNVKTEWTQFTVPIDTPGVYFARARLSSENTADKRIQMILANQGDAVHTTLVFTKKPISGSTQKWNDFITIEHPETEMTLPAGNQTIRFEALDSHADFDWFELFTKGDSDCNPIPPVVHTILYETDKTTGILYMRAASVTTGSQARSTLSNEIPIDIADWLVGSRFTPAIPANLRTE